MYTLEEIYEEALSTSYPPVSTGKSLIRRGVKIQRFSDKIEILNMGKGGSYYQECTKKEYKFFADFGWKIGCLYISIENCLHRLNLIEAKIKSEVNSRKNDKHIKRLKNKRGAILLKYASYKLKLNQ
jgi:hypothetical protein|tara:strand:+ start:959 stop:1339 length:381 start_codon:yes stop_codon:yes gene_type:complete